MMKLNSLCLVIAASFVFSYVQAGDGAELEREKRDDNEWIVTTLIEKPYVSKKKDPALKNEDYEGYIPDMLKRISEKLNQKYRIREVGDQKYGVYDEHKRKWSGMIGEVKESKADLAAAPITVSAARREAVDFTTPFMTFGTVILLKRPTNASDPGPKTVHNLLDQASLRYGVVNEGSTEQLVRSSSDADVSRLQERLEPVTTQEEGVNRVRNSQGKFAFVIEENTAKYWKKQPPCELMTITIDQLSTRDYALALRKNSPHTEKINQALKEMKDSGELEALQEKWWSGPCSGASKMTSGTMALTLVLLGFVGRYAKV